MLRNLLIFICLCFTAIVFAVETDYLHTKFGIPAEPDILLSREGFAVGYSKKYRQAVWVSYILTSDNLRKKQLRRSNKFMPDPAIRRRAVKPVDYKRSGFDRGHLAPAADMTYALDPMTHSFFMSNISPQIPGCNRGIWKRLESQVRQWALTEEQLCIVTGPLFKKRNRRMPQSRIPIPYAFYKVILDMTPPQKMIAFIIPNQTTKKRLASFAVTVDTVEFLTGCDFFSSLPDEEEEKMESTLSFQNWQSRKN